ncbi:MAG TPA: thiamine phosphate synthase [Thermopetrobacter sp.]|nr:thiamine phosphate synthase [Thermopetrobacter sp.]
MTQTHSPRLFVIAPAGLEASAAAACLHAAATAGDIACLLLQADARGHVDPGLARALTRAAHEHDIATLIANDAALARAVGADGVHVTTGPAALRAARAALPGDAIVGAEAGGGRHLAMTLGEAGADYLAIDPARHAKGEPLLSWCAEMLVLPVVAFAPAPPEALPALIRAGADFVCPAPAMWDGPEAARRVIAASMAAMTTEAAE